jgi:hypothetical protein
MQACYLIHDGFLLGLLFFPEDGGKIFFRNLCQRAYSRRYVKEQRFLKLRNFVDRFQSFRGACCLFCLKEGGNKCLRKACTKLYGITAIIAKKLKYFQRLILLFTIP